MTPDILFVKNMVCHRCILATEDILRKLDIPFKQVIVGEIHLYEDLPADQLNVLGGSLSSIGLELIDFKARGIIEKIKKLVIARARMDGDETDQKRKLSVYLSARLHHDHPVTRAE